MAQTPSLNSYCNALPAESPRQVGNVAAKPKGRLSLSNWYEDATPDPPSGSDEHAGSKRSSVRNHGEAHSPLKRGRTQSRSDYFIGRDSSEEDPRSGSGWARMPHFNFSRLDTSSCQSSTAATMLGQICDEYFDRNVNPIIHELLKIQREQDVKLRALQNEVYNKAEQDENLVLARVKEFADYLVQKTDALAVQELANKVEAVAGTGNSRAEERVFASQQRLDVQDDPTHVQILKLSEDVRAELHELREEFREKLQAELEPRLMTTTLDADLRRIDQQVQQLREHWLVVGERWPERVSSSLLGSEIGSEVASVADSIGESATSSVMALGPEEISELLLPHTGTYERSRIWARRQRRQERLARKGKSSLTTHLESEGVTQPGAQQACPFPWQQ